MADVTDRCESDYQPRHIRHIKAVYRWFGGFRSIHGKVVSIIYGNTMFCGYKRLHTRRASFKSEAAGVHPISVAFLRDMLM